MHSRPAPKNWQKVISPSATAIKLLPGGAGISIPEWEEEAPLVGEVRFPKGELILVYPGIGHTKPLGFVAIISESKFSEFDNDLELIIGIKNILINNEIKMIKIIVIRNIFGIKIHLLVL